MQYPGYIRLSQAALHKMYLAHLISGVDEDRPACDDDATLMAITGYTEWISEGDKVVTVGWDWLMRYGDDGLRLERTSEPRSNLMVQDMDRKDMGPHGSTALLACVIDNFHWQEETLRYINNRYRN